MLKAGHIFCQPLCAIVISYVRQEVLLQIIFSITLAFCLILTKLAYHNSQVSQLVSCEQLSGEISCKWWQQDELRNTFLSLHT